MGDEEKIGCCGLFFHFNRLFLNNAKPQKVLAHYHFLREIGKIPPDGIKLMRLGLKSGSNGLKLVRFGLESGFNGLKLVRDGLKRGSNGIKLMRFGLESGSNGIKRDVLGLSGEVFGVTMQNIPKELVFLYLEEANDYKKRQIAKLRKQKSVEMTGEEYKGKYVLSRKSAKEYIKSNLRGEYYVNDTGENVLLAKDGAQKITSHSMGSEAYLKSIFSIPELLRKAIFIEERSNEKDNDKYDRYRYYVVGLKIGDVDYTVKITVGVDEYGNKYYDQSLTEIEKGNLIDEVGALSTTLPSNNKDSLSGIKDTKLIAILQTNDLENERRI
ncbi:MAG: hypothetical protein LBM06_08450 [Prevotellaceae bacterium]|nr:hypothetical protein [Prevotellaceae bacterium]